MVQIKGTLSPSIQIHGEMNKDLKPKGPVKYQLLEEIDFYDIAVQLIVVDLFWLEPLLRLRKRL